MQTSIPLLDSTMHGMVPESVSLIPCVVQHPQPFSKLSQPINK